MHAVGYLYIFVLVYRIRMLRASGRAVRGADLGPHDRVATTIKTLLESDMRRPTP